MNQATKKTSLKETVMSAIGEFLYEEKFASSGELKEGVLELINSISDYYEEGQHLFPEVIIVNDIDFFKTISDRKIIIKKVPLRKAEFSNILKLCAPLAVGSWNIFIEVKDEITFGLIDAEITETSPSLYEQAVGKLAVKPENISVAYIQNIGIKTVKLIGLERKLIVSLSLNDIEYDEDNATSSISKDITENCPEEHKINITTLLNKTISEALRVGHGNLIGLIDDSPDSIEQIKAEFSDCIYLEESIDLAEFVRYAESEKSGEASVNLISYTKILISMLNHDGITILTTNGKIIGYHMFIPPIVSEDNPVIIGGARTRAYQSMVNSGKFSSCFYKSQDGKTQYWKKQ